MYIVELEKYADGVWEKIMVNFDPKHIPSKELPIPNTFEKILLWFLSTSGKALRIKL